ncbi:MAG: DUF58 domain-containing protein [Gemmatimonadota bacterium]|nr:MAG: DUF58 domain-containing protein [Gemmatimonadota bacterium]
MKTSQFLDPKVLARIDNIDLLARTVVDGFINGLHHSPYFGLSVDFAEHRPYMPGDDIRRIDWRVFGRTDRFYVKEYEADTNANFSILFDISRSMDYTSHEVTKLDYGRYLAACLAYFSRQQRDRVGMVTFDADIVDYVPASAKHLDIVLHTIDRISAREPGTLEAPLLKVAEMLRRRSILVLISDLYEDPETVVKALSRLRHKGNDVIVFHVLDPAEVEFPFDEAAHFEDLESGERIPVVPETLREQYRTLMSQHMTTLSDRLIGNDIDYCRFVTSTPLDYALFEYLSRRERMSRVR